MKAEDRKERVLHTRIPASLEEEIKRVAGALRVPVSNLVRQILEDTVQLVANVGETVGEIEREVGRDRARLHERWARYRGLFQRFGAGPRRRGGVFGWQPLILNAAAACEACGAALAPGAAAFMGLSDDPGVRPFRCECCVPRAPSEESNPRAGGAHDGHGPEEEP